ncbi:hypothetical protein [Roseobacter sp.]|uniref:hypothetical protein n=1 Tax=Roseobacter sp. TaxID=1907202 RepID=UPI00385947F6
MSDIRNRMFANIDRAASSPVNEDFAEATATLIADPTTNRPAFLEQSYFECFVEKATSESVAATVENLDSVAALPNAVLRQMLKQR